MKKRISLLLALMLAFGCASAAFAVETPDDFTPVMRFVTASDTHILADSYENDERIGRMLRLAYDVADADGDYTGLDAFLVVGDLTNDGTKEEFDRLAAAVNGSMREGTRFLGVAAKNHDGWDMRRKDMRAYYSQVTGNDPDFNVVIGGYHFIGLSASSVDASHYDGGQLNWLKEQLDAAVAEDPDRPIFFMHHEPVRGTVYGSSLYDGWGTNHFAALLRKYPQVVDFAGHSHYPLNDPRSVWQGEFTAINTGAIKYAEFTVEGHRTYHPADYYDTATCWIMELDASHNMRLRGYDVNAGGQLCEVYLPNPANPANRQYTPKNRAAASLPPVFDDDAALTVETFAGGCTVTAPVAASADGMPVVLYRAYAKNATGRKVLKSWTLPCYYRAVELETVELKLDGLTPGDYTVGVIAENAYGGDSQPLETAVHIEKIGGIGSLFARIAAWFTELWALLVKHL